MFSLVLLTGFLGLELPADAEESWPSWRGSRGDGSSPDETVPLEWNVQKNTIWKKSLPGKGHASPNVWKAHVFVVAAVEDLSLIHIRRCRPYSL